MHHRGCLLLLLATGCAKHDAPAPVTRIELQSNYAEVYPQLEDVAIRSIAPLDSGIGVALTLRSDRDRFSAFSVSFDDGSPPQLTDEVVRVEFPNDHRTAETATKWLTIVALNTEGAASSPRHLRINWNPPELYAAAGRSAKGVAFISASEVKIAPWRVQDWVVDHPAPEDVAFAERTWGALVAAEPAPFEKSRALAKAILRVLAPRRGIPSDAMDELPPFAQYERAASGLDQVECENLTDIFVRAAISLGLIARRLDLNDNVIDGARAQVAMSDSHTTTEIFDSTRNRWIWIDLEIDVLGAELAGLGLLHYADLRRVISDPTLASTLSVTTYDSGKDLEKTGAPSDDTLGFLLGFTARDQALVFSRPTRM